MSGGKKKTYARTFLPVDHGDSTTDSQAVASIGGKSFNINV